MNTLCLLFGHPVAPSHFVEKPAKNCRCNAELRRDDTLTRIRHHASCFLKGHEYRKLGQRSGYEDFGCIQCGHPLLLREGEPSPETVLKKKVRYRCNVFGHKHLEEVSTRYGRVEYACACGHSFLKEEAGLKEINHPLRCFFLGHWVRYLGERSGASDYTCIHCGHLFYW